MTFITQRFVRGTAFSSGMIVAQEKTAMPFTPSHVEALSEDSQFYIGAHIDGGVMKRPVSYDKGMIAQLQGDYDKTVFPDGLCDMRLKLDVTPEQAAVFYAFLDRHINEPYDSPAIWGFVIPIHSHTVGRVICSALQSLALRACGYFQTPLAAPAHLIDPRDLLLMISGRQQVPGI